MDASKVPVKLVKVIKVLGRTGNKKPPPLPSSPPTQLPCNAVTMKTPLTYPLIRLPRRRHPSPRRIHGRPDTKHHPKCKRTRYVPFHISPQRLLPSRQKTFYQEEEGDEKIHTSEKRPLNETSASDEQVYPHPSSIHFRTKRKIALMGATVRRMFRKNTGRYIIEQVLTSPHNSTRRRHPLPPRIRA